MRSAKRILGALSCLMLVFISTPASAQLIDDLMISYQHMEITEAIVGGETKKPSFLRHFTLIELGIRNGTIGLMHQATRKGKSSSPGVEEEGLMLTGGYNHFFGETFRLEAYGRLGLTDDTNDGQPLYSTDTDFRLNAVKFNPFGVGSFFGKSFFPSAYLGGVINKYGRFQMIAGLGNWWNKIGMYATMFHAFNGVENPGTVSEADKDKSFANLKNSGISLSATYEIRDLMFLVKKNFARENSGNDFALSLQYRFFFLSEAML